MKNKSFIQIVFEVIFIFLSSALGCGFIGNMLDKKLNTSPIFLLIFLVFGVFLSLYLLYLYNKNI